MNDQLAALINRRLELKQRLIVASKRGDLSRVTDLKRRIARLTVTIEAIEDGTVDNVVGGVS